MSQSLLNRTSSYASCYSAITTTMPTSSIKRHGSIESLLYGHSKANPANIPILVRKNFQPFAQAHIAVTKGNIIDMISTSKEYVPDVCRYALIRLGYIKQYFSRLAPFSQVTYSRHICQRGLIRKKEKE